MVSGGGDAPFAFEYTGDYTDNRDANGIGKVEFTSSGTLTVLSGIVTVLVYILGAGGGGAHSRYGTATNIQACKAGGGGGGNQTVEVELTPGTYDIVIGAGGTSRLSTTATKMTGGNGGATTAFGKTSTGGKGGVAYWADKIYTGGAGGSPNGGMGSATQSGASYTTSGGAPNGGNSSSNGGDGLVRITFS